MQKRVLIPPVLPLIVFVGLVAIALIAPAFSRWMIERLGVDGVWKDLAIGFPGAVGIAWGAWMWLSRHTARGVLWWQAVKSLFVPLMMNYSISVSFLPVTVPPADAILATVKEWDGSDAFEVIARRDYPAEVDGASWQLDLHTERLGAIVVAALPRHPGQTDDDSRYVTVSTRSARHDMRTLAHFIEADWITVTEKVGRLLGQPHGIRFTGAFEEEANPYYGLYVRDEAARTGLREFSAVFVPPGAGATDEVRVDQRGIAIAASSLTAFRSVVHGYIGLAAGR